MRRWMQGFACPINRPCPVHSLCAVHTEIPEVSAKIRIVTFPLARCFLRFAISLRVNLRSGGLLWNTAGSCYAKVSLCHVVSDTDRLCGDGQRRVYGRR